MNTERAYERLELHGDSLLVPRQRAKEVDFLIRLDSGLLRPDEGLLVAPLWSSAYPILKRKAPLWDIFFATEENEPRQAMMIERLKSSNVNWVVLGDIARDGKEERRFRNTHALVWRHIMDNFKEVEYGGAPPEYTIWRRSGAR